jgi:hypothetical protein
LLRISATPISESPFRRDAQLLLPDAGEVQEPVNENVFGEVRGQSRVANRLQIRLIPDTSRIQMRLEAMGKVFSQTEAQAAASRFKTWVMPASRFLSDWRLAATELRLTSPRLGLLDQQDGRDAIRA